MDSGQKQHVPHPAHVPVHHKDQRIRDARVSTRNSEPRTELFKLKPRRRDGVNGLEFALFSQARQSWSVGSQRAVDFWRIISPAGPWNELSRVVTLNVDLLQKGII